MGFTNEDNKTTAAMTRMKVKNGDVLSEQVETLSQDQGEVTLATAATGPDDSS